MVAGRTRRSVWVVDDSPLDAERATRALSADYQVVTFTEAPAAVERIATGGSPDVMVLDWMMPGMSGIDVCQFLRTPGGPHERVGVLLLTAARDTSQIVSGLSAGADDYLAKPYADAELVARVRALMRTRQLLERSERAEAQVRSFLEGAPDALLAFDERGTVMFANEAAGRVFDQSASALVGIEGQQVIPGLERLKWPPDDTVVRLADLAVGGRMYAPIFSARRAGPAPAHSTLALRDVTERRREEARRAEFYSMVVHDMRSPLMALSLRNTLMERGQYGPVSSTQAGELRKNGVTIQSLVKLITDFLDVARFEEKGIKLDRQTVEMAELTRACLDELRPLADARQLKLRFEEAGMSLPVFGDRPRLMQVLSNLLSNAIKFTPPGGAIAVRSRRAGGFVETSVADDGPGIPAAALPTLFDRFTRVEATAGTSGTGLGLTIAKQIVEAHGGSISVESREGQGSTFLVALPLSEAA